MFTVEIICFGNELLIGKTVNTNASWLGKRLVALGGNLQRITTASDTIEDMIQVIKEVLARKPQVIITSGGLGPTFDDMTLVAVAKAIDNELELNEEAIKLIKNRIAEVKETRGVTLKLTEERKQMAMLPKGAIPLQNRAGTAPGVIVDYEETRFIILPGVPKEMKAIFDFEAVQYLPKDPNYQYLERSLKVNFIPESELAKAISTIRVNYPQVYFKTHPRTYTSVDGTIEVEIHLTYVGVVEDEYLLDTILEELITLIEQLKGAKGEDPKIEVLPSKESMSDK
jgi:molybdenum cofactor synthesis domain-containing protein